MGIVAIIIAILELSKAADRHVLFGIRCIGIVLSSTLTVVTFYRHKITMIRRNLTSRSQKGANNTSLKMRTASNLTSTSNGTVSSADGEEKYKRLKEKYSKLKKDHEVLFSRYEDVTRQLLNRDVESPISDTSSDGK